MLRSRVKTGFVPNSCRISGQFHKNSARNISPHERCDERKESDMEVV